MHASQQIEPQTFDASRQWLLRRGIWLSAIVLVWNVVEGIVAVAAGLVANSVALISFGIDSSIEVTSALVVTWRLWAELRRGGADRAEQLERRAAPLARSLLLLLAVYIVVDAGRRLLGFGQEPETSLVGIVLTSLSLIVMPLVGWAKLRTATALNSAALRADSYETITCAWLSLTTLTGLALNAALGWSWADPVAALVIVPLILREAWRVESGEGVESGELRVESEEGVESVELRVESKEPTSNATRKPSSFRLSTLNTQLSTLLVLCALAAVGYWGHRTGWRLPPFSQLVGNVAHDDVDWCAEHGVPESICVACRADLMPKGELHGWCREHGVAECVLEHPELAQLKTVPTISQADLDRARRALETRPRPSNDPLCKLHLRRIQFASREAADKAGIDIALVDRGPIVETITANGQVRYDPTRVARLSSRADGSVWRVDKNIGDDVVEGEVIALVDAVQVGRAKAELLEATARLDLGTKTASRLAGLESVVGGRRLQEADAARAEAEAAVRKAVQALINLGLPLTLDEVRGITTEQLVENIQLLGLPASVTEGLDPDRTTANLLPVVAPRAGTVVSRDVVAGEVIDTAKTLLTIVDTSRMWLLLDVPFEQTKYVALGQKVIFRPDGYSDDHEGRIAWISPEVDAETRTVKVRAELPNDDGALLSESFGAGRIVLREEDDAILVPKQAIHWEGCCHVAFVRDKDFLKENAYQVFHTRMVRPGVTLAGKTEVIAGLLPGEVIVTQGSGILRSELLKGNLGAG